MVRWVAWIGVVALAGVLVGCPKKPPPDEDAVDAAVVPTATAPDPTAPSAPTGGAAANEADVTHYPDQVPGNQEPLTAHVTTSARSEASSINGKVIATVRSGTQAVKLADHDGFYLVLFTDPLDASRKIEGWLPHSDFLGFFHASDASAPAHPPHDAAAPPSSPPHPARPLDVKKVSGVCPGGYASCGAICRLVCRSDGDCGIAGVHCSAGFCLGPGTSPCAH